MILTTILALTTAALPIYEGRVYDPNSVPNASPEYVYERRVAVAEDGSLTASHLTRQPGSDTLLIDESAQVSASYALRRFDADNRQQGFTGHVTVSADGRQLDYELRRANGSVSRRSEQITAPAVTGPSLHGFILQHWDRLLANDKVDVRMIVLSETTTYGFVIALKSQGEGHTAFSITPSSWLVRMAVAPLSVTFDSNSRHVLRYEGRVPPQLLSNGKARDFDARVDYTMKAAAYR